jgi:hypothetical protein
VYLLLCCLRTIVSIGVSAIYTYSNIIRSRSRDKQTNQGTELAGIARTADERQTERRGKHAGKREGSISYKLRKSRSARINVGNVQGATENPPHARTRAQATHGIRTRHYSKMANAGRGGIELGPRCGRVTASERSLRIPAFIAHVGDPEDRYSRPASCMVALYTVSTALGTDANGISDRRGHEPCAVSWTTACSSVSALASVDGANKNHSTRRLSERADH